MRRAQLRARVRVAGAIRRICELQGSRGGGDGGQLVLRLQPCNSSLLAPLLQVELVANPSIVFMDEPTTGGWIIVEHLPPTELALQPLHLCLLVTAKWRFCIA